MKTFKCTDGFVAKTISAVSATDAAERYAIVSSTVQVTELDEDGNIIGEVEDVDVVIE